MNLSDFNVKTYGNGMPIIMLHGFQLDQTSLIATFEPIMENLPFKRIYLDLPGMGLNANVAAIQNADDMLNAIIEAIEDTIQDEAFCVVGMSYGGYLARGIAHLLKDRCKGLFLFVPVVYPKFEARTLPAHEVVYEDQNYTKDLDQETLNALREMNVIITAHSVARQKEEIDAAIARGNAAFLETYQATGYQASFDVDENSAAFNYPVMIVAGKQDSVVGYEDQFHLSQRYKRATFMALDGAGHGLNYEQEAAFTACFKLWLSQI